jgi:hypothetical protein
MRPARVLAAALAITAAPLLAAADDLILGFPDPDQSLTITRDTRIDGNIILLNRAALNLRAGTLTVTGRIYLLDNTALTSDGATLSLEQAFAYDSGLYVTGNALVDFRNTHIRAANRSFGVGMAGTARVAYSNVSVDNGFCTWAIDGSSTATLTNVTNAGEFLLLGASRADITRSSTVLFWLVLPRGSTIDTTLPAPGNVPSFSLTPTTPWASGIPYSATISDCSDVSFGIMARSGSSSTIRNSTLRGVGTLFDDDTVTITGLANDTRLADSTFNWGSITHRFVNTAVRTWNFYSYGSSSVTLNSCVFGELLAAENGRATISGSICDGTGGYIGAAGDSTVFFVSSANLSQTIVSERGLLVAAESALIGADVFARDDSVLALVNTTTRRAPGIRDGATLFDAAIEGLSQDIGRPASLRGTAQIVPGPRSAARFNAYSVEFADAENPVGWSRIAGPVRSQVRSGELASWDTRGLAPGLYAVRVRLFPQVGDPVDATAYATLFPNPCAADVNADGFLDFFDVIEFFDAFDAGTAAADFNTDGFVDFFDSNDFVAAFQTGC